LLRIVISIGKVLLVALTEVPTKLILPLYFSPIALTSIVLISPFLTEEIKFSGTPAAI